MAPGKVLNLPVPVQTLHLGDVDELSPLIPNADLRYTQVAPGRSPVRVKQLRTAGLTLLNVFMANETLARATSEDVGKYYLALPVRWRGTLSWSGHVIDRPSIMAWGQAPEYVRRGRDIEALVLFFERDDFLDAVSAWTGREPKPWRQQFGRPLPLAGSALTLPGALNATLRMLEHHPEALATPTACNSFVETLTGKIIEAQETSGFAGEKPTRSLLSRSRIVQRADEYVQACLHGHVSKLALCRAIGVSARSLDYAFRDICGMTMSQYLKVHRLRLARRLLHRGNSRIASVKQCALDAGFLQLGRFSVDYRQFFGESPSRTLSHQPGQLT